MECLQKIINLVYNIFLHLRESIAVNISASIHPTTVPSHALSIYVLSLLNYCLKFESTNILLHWLNVLFNLLRVLLSAFTNVLMKWITVVMLYLNFYLSKPSWQFFESIQWRIINLLLNKALIFQCFNLCCLFFNLVLALFNPQVLLFVECSLRIKLRLQVLYSISSSRQFFNLLLNFVDLLIERSLIRAHWCKVWALRHLWCFFPDTLILD